jgi:hypothetical protein
MDRWLVLGFVGFVCVLSSTQAAIKEAWVQRYNGPANGSDGGKALAIDRNGDVPVAGSSHNGTNFDYDYFTAKYARTNGALLWERRYAGGPSNSWDVLKAMAVDGNGNVFVTGDTKVRQVGPFTEGRDFYTAGTATIWFFTRALDLVGETPTSAGGTPRSPN